MQSEGIGRKSSSLLTILVNGISAASKNEFFLKKEGPFEKSDYLLWVFLFISIP